MLKHAAHLRRSRHQDLCRSGVRRSRRRNLLERLVACNANREPHRQLRICCVQIAGGQGGGCGVDEQDVMPAESPARIAFGWPLAGNNAAGACIACCRHTSFECIAAAAALACSNHEQHWQMPAQVASLELECCHKLGHMPACEIDLQLTCLRCRRC